MKLQGSKLIVRNTGILYAKTFITMGISLYSTRVILNALGATDFGIYSLVGGVIAMLTFLNNSMTQATQRFLNFNLGAGNLVKLHQIFNASVYLHLIIGVLVVAIVELGGYFAFEYFLNIPVDRLEAAKIIFHLVVASTFFSIISVPYDAVINAHEHMLFDSILGILQALGILIIALIVKQTTGDKLIWYGALMVTLIFLLLIVRRVYCRSQYTESRIDLKKYLNKSVIAEMVKYAKYTLLSAITSMIGAWGVTVLINKFFGPKLNAAHGVAIQINGQILVFSNALMKAINPQLTKSTAVNDRQRMFDLVHSATKFSYLLLAVFAIPFILEAPFILKLWLKSPPNYAVLFCQFALVVSLLGQLSMPVANIINSNGNIKALSFYSSIVFALILPIVFTLFYFNFPVYYFYIVQIINELVLLFIRLKEAKRILYYQFTSFYVNVFKPLVIITIPMILFGILIQNTMNRGLFRLSVTLFTTTITLITLTYLWGLKKNEKEMLNFLINKYLKIGKQ